MALPDGRRALIEIALASAQTREGLLATRLIASSLPILPTRPIWRFPFHSMRGCSVLLLTKPQLPTVLALLSLDGVARRLLIGLPDLNRLTCRR